MRRASSFVLLVLLLSGCAGQGGGADAGEGGEAEPLGGTGAGHTLAALDASSSVQAPDWAVGQWWEWETSFGSETSDSTFRSIVVATEGSTFTLATDDDGMAKEEAAWNVPLLGPVQRSGLAMDGWGDQPWSLLEFPLTDGKAWTATMPNIAWDIVAAPTVDLAVTARFDDGIGERGGFRLEGMLQDARLMEAEYDPTAGWFTGLRFFDVDPGEEALEIGFRAVAQGLNYTGPYFLHTARVLLALEDLVGFDNVPVVNNGQPFTQAPQPHHAFTMGEGTTLYGVIIAEVVAGGRVVTLIDPASQHREVTAAGHVDGGEGVLILDEPGQAGEWKLETAGAGGFSGAFAFLAEITEGAHAL